MRLRITNGANLGLARAFHHFLAEGKEPPVFDSEGPTFKVVARSQQAVPEFVQFANRHRWLTVDDLLVVRHLSTHREMTGREAADLCQRRPSEMHQLLVDLTTRKRVLEADPFARYVRTYRLTRGIHEELGKACSYVIDGRPTSENLKARILAALAGKPLTNAEVREITLLERTQAWRLMKQLEEEGLASRLGRGRFARWQLAGASKL